MIAKRPWTDPKEISIHEVPVKSPTPYLVLLNDLVLRLEQTPKNRALVLDFDTAEDLKVAFRTLTRLAPRRLGKNQIAFVRGQRMDGTPALFVHHGSKWGHNGKAEQEVERREQVSQR